MKGISKKVVESISEQKNEPKWMKDFRVKAYMSFESFSNPSFGPNLDINFDDITYYKKVGEKVEDDWNNVPKDARETFCSLGLMDAEKNI